MIDLSRSRKRSDERAIAFEITDMVTATAPEEPYDRLASRFGIMIFGDPLAALANLAAGSRPAVLRLSFTDFWTDGPTPRRRDRAGYGELDVGDWREVLPVGGGLPAAEAANFALASFSSFGELLAEAGNEALNYARLFRHQQDGPVWMNASVHIFTGARLALGSIAPPETESCGLCSPSIVVMIECSACCETK